MVKQSNSKIPEREIKRYARRWISIGRRPMPTILKRSTSSTLRTRCWITHSRVSEHAAEQHTEAARQSAEQQALYCVTNRWQRRSLGHRVRPDV